MNRLRTTSSFLRYRASGFTLLEVLVALLVFGFGMLGVSLYTGNALIEIADNNARAMALNTASQQLEPLYIAAGTGAATFKTALTAIAQGNAQTVGGNSSKDQFLLAITQAQDSSPVPIDLLASADPSLWVSPLTIAVQVSYVGRKVYEGDDGTKTANASFTFITP